METKKCNHCKEDKPLTEFYKHKGFKDGFLINCKTCTKDKIKIWEKENPEKKSRWRKKNPEKIKEANKRFKKENPEKKSRWRKKNPEKIKESSKQAIENLVNGYVISLIRDTTGLKTETILKHPELIESKRISIKIKRLLKQKSNENTKAS